MITHKQLTLAEVFEDYQNKFDNDKYQFLSLLDEAINLDEIVPVSFVSHFHARTGRPRKHQLYPMLKALLLQRIFSIPTDTLLTEPICQKLAGMTIFDTSGIEAWVTENNPKYANRIIKQLVLQDVWINFYHYRPLAKVQKKVAIKRYVSLQPNHLCLLALDF